MGLLDDAIREHLELKRRRGADASEISQQESDALGPVRRSPEGVPDLSDLDPLHDTELAAEPDAPALSEAPSPWEEETTVHAPPSEPIYEPPPVPAAPAAPPAAAYEPPAVPPPPPPASPPPLPDETEEPPAEEPSHPSLLSRLNPAGRMRHSRREHADEPAVPDPPPLVPPEPPAAAEEPPPAAYEPPAHEPDIIPADDEPEGEDLLEETPDFLEETPEHDRLWFEQRPPRDFNFDD
jgi:hypothetical protein